MLMHLNSKAKLKWYYQCLWSNLLHYGFPIDARRTNRSFSTKKLSKKIRRNLRRYTTFFLQRILFHPEKSTIIIGIQLIAFLMIFAAFSAMQYCSCSCVSPFNIETKTPFEAWIQTAVCLKGFFHLCSFTSHRYYALAVRVISYGDYFNYISGTFFIRN